MFAATLASDLAKINNVDNAAFTKITFKMTI